MDENNDPYEQRLMAVFKSCLTNGQTELEEDAWCSLCSKLQLDEYSDTLKSCIQKSEKQSISYEEFRDALLMLLGKQETIVVGDELILNSQQDMKILNITHRECGSVQPQNCDSQVDIEKMKTCIMLEKDELRNLCDKLNTCLNEESSEMFCISNCLGIPTLPKQMVQRIFEKLDGNCDGLIDLNEFCIIFENHKTLPEQASLEWNNEFRRDLPKQNSEENIFHMLGPHHTGFVQRCSIVEMWKIAGIPDAASLLTDLGLVSPDIRLTDLMAVLSNELKGLSDLSDHTSIQVHINLLRGALVLYQEELRSLNTLLKNLGGERDKLRSDIAEANERANSLAQEIDYHHARQDELRQDLLKKVEQRYSETIKELGMQLTSEQEASAAVVKAKEQQLQALQQENNQNKVKVLHALKENHALEAENENLRERISTLQTTNTELLNQLKILEAEHDEANSLEIAEQSEVLQLMERIKKLQSEMVLLRDQNDELTVELEFYKTRNNHMSSTRHDSLLLNSERGILDSEESQENVSDKSLGDQEMVAKNPLDHVHSISCDSLPEGSTEQNLSPGNAADCPIVVIKELRNILTRDSDCSSKNCAFKDGISNVIGRIESELQSQPSSKQCDVVKSLASELETESQQKTGEQLRDFVSKPNKSKRSAPANIKGNAKATTIDDNINSADSKGTSTNKSLRDYPPRKDENSSSDQQKSVNSVNDDDAKNNSNCNSDENNARVDSINISLQEQEAKHAAEKEKLVERCEELERTLELLRVEYDECEDYWALKLEEERQLFEQEQKISDEKFSELIAKIEEYEELLKPEDKSKSDGRLSPIEEKFNLEQQYTDLEDEFNKYKLKTEEDISQKDKEIEKLNESIRTAEMITKSDISVQVPDETALPSTNHVSFPVMSPLAQPFNIKSQYDIDAQKLYDSFKLDDISETSDSMNDLVTHAVKAEDIVDGYGLEQFRSICSMSDAHGTHPTNEFSAMQSKLPDHDSLHHCFSKENSMHHAACGRYYEEKHRSTEEILKLRNAKRFNEPCMQSGAQEPSLNADVNLIQALQKKLRSQERKMRKMQEVFKRRQHRLEEVLHNTWAQHNVQTSELQYLLCATQEKLQLQIQVTEEQTKKLARADILAQNLYVENACLMANVKRLEERCRMLT